MPITQTVAYKYPGFSVGDLVGIREEKQTPVGQQVTFKEGFVSSMIPVRDKNGVFSHWSYVVELVVSAAKQTVSEEDLVGRMYAMKQFTKKM